jgi:hypothetical protein
VINNRNAHNADYTEKYYSQGVGSEIYQLGLIGMSILVNGECSLQDTKNPGQDYIEKMVPSEIKGQADQE